MNTVLPFRETLPFRVGVQQRVFPAYRAPFFDALARVCAGGLSVFAGDPMQDEALGMEGQVEIAQRVVARNLYLGWGPFLLVLQRGIIDWLEHWQPDVLITDSNPRNASTNAAIRWMRARGRPVIGWGLGAPPIRKGPAGWFDASRRGFLRQFDALISYSQTGAEQFVTASGLAKDRVYIAPNAVTPRPTQPPPERGEQFRDGRATVLYVGRLQARKRLDALMRGCAALPGEQQPRLQLVGDGPARDELEALARQIYPMAQLLGDRRGMELEAIFAGADLFVLPGTGGLAVQQAMSYALPVIVAEADGTQNTLVRPENGWIVPPENEQALQTCLREALADPARLRRMGLESYRIVVDEVNLERMVAVFAQVIAAVGREAHARALGR